MQESFVTVTLFWRGHCNPKPLLSFVVPGNQTFVLISRICLHGGNTCIQTKLIRNCYVNHTIEVRLSGDCADYYILCWFCRIFFISLVSIHSQGGLLALGDFNENVTKLRYLHCRFSRWIIIFLYETLLLPILERL